ncbi:gamma-glutamyltransferase family protein, partial [Planctomycetota bacterium]
MKEAIRKKIVLVSCVALMFASCVLAQDWPQWRGPNRAGKLNGFTAPQKWPAELAQKWRVTIGFGDSTPALLGDKLYVSARQGEEEVILCLNAANRKELWNNKYTVQAVTGPASWHPGPRSSPAVVNGKVVTLAGYGSSDAAELGWEASGRNGVVVAGRTGSAEAGFEILKAGGNAADAAVATLLALSVTDSDQFNFGSEMGVLVYDAKRGVVESISGVGETPALGTLEHYQEVGGIKDDRIGAMPVPAPVGVFCTLLDRYGTMRFAEVAAPALRLLDRHERDWHAPLARTIQRLIEAEKDAKDRRRGIRLVEDYFYRGPIAREIDVWSRGNGGLIRYTDMARHTARVEEPVSATYRGYAVYKCNTWTQGPWLLQALKLIEGFDIKSMGYMSADTIHLRVEASKLALADRDVYYGDPLFVDVPLKELFSREYNDMRRPLIDMQQASMVQCPGDPLGGKALLDPERTKAGLRTAKSGDDNDTTTCVTADRWGNAVAITPSGGGPLAGDTGIRTSGRLVQLNTFSGHPNCIKPGKRPRITLTPSMVLKDGKPVIIISVAGGDTQDQGTLQMIINHLEFGKTAPELVSGPRCSTGHLIGSFSQLPPSLGGLTLGTKTDPAVVEELKRRGH